MLFPGLESQIRYLLLLELEGEKSDCSFKAAQNYTVMHVFYCHSWHGIYKLNDLGVQT